MISARYLVLLCEAFLCSELREELQQHGYMGTASTIFFTEEIPATPRVLRCLVQGFWDVLPLEALRAAHLEAVHQHVRETFWFLKCFCEASDLAILLTGSCGVVPRCTVQHRGQGGIPHLFYQQTCAARTLNWGSLLGGGLSSFFECAWCANLVLFC